MVNFKPWKERTCDLPRQAKVSSSSRTKRGKLEKGVSEGSKMRGAALQHMKKLSVKRLFLTRVKGVPPLSGIAVKVVRRHRLL
jgi:hypothetical protein